MRFAEHRWRWLVGLYCGTVLSCVALQPPPVVLWVLLNAVGFSYVAAATEERADPWLSRRGDHRQFALLLLASPALFWLAPAFTLLPSSAALSPSHLSRLNQESSEQTRIIWFEGWSSRIESEGSFWGYVGYTAGCYCLPFFVGLHFTYLDFVPWLQRIELNARSLRRFSPSHWLFLAAVFLAALLLAAYFIMLFVSYDILLPYLLGVAAVGLPGVAVVLHLVLRRGHSLHVHHYQLFAALLLPTRFQNALSAVLQGLLAGAYVEGVARWGMGPLLIPPPPS